MTRFGILTEVDVTVLQEGLDLIIARFAGPLRVAEIGVCHGDTARGIRDYLQGRGREIAYIGFDNERDRSIAPPFEGAAIHRGDSAELFDRLPTETHFLAIDGCHCVNHVMLDFLHYADRVALGGIVFCHDVNPAAQRKGDYQGHGPRDNLDFGTSTREALRKLGLWDDRRLDWRKVLARWDAQDWGGAALFERIKA